LREAPSPKSVRLDTGDADVVLARITTQSRKSNHDVAMTQWRASGLLGPSIVRLHKIVTSEKVQVIRVLGTLQATDRQQVATVLHQTFANW